MTSPAHAPADCNPLHAAHYADRAVWTRVEVRENVQLARDTFRVRFHHPAMARRFTPGQFLMLRLAGSNDPLLGRAFALYDTVDDPADPGDPIGVDVVYLVVGKLTSRLAEYRPGQRLEVWGPLGNGFSAEAVDHLILVAGGIGMTPFPALAREFLGRRRYGEPPRHVPASRRVTFCYGVRSADYLIDTAPLANLGVDVRIATDNGTAGRHGFVTDLLREVLAENTPAESSQSATTVPARRIACCGPEPMLKAVAEIAAAHGVRCEVSLETPMACGLGICFSCVTRVHLDPPPPKGATPWDYQRSCVEGPIFDAARLVW